MHDNYSHKSFDLYTVYIYIYGLFQQVFFGGGWEPRPRNLDEPAAELAGKEVDLVVMPPSPRAVTGGHGWPRVAMGGHGGMGNERVLGRNPIFEPSHAAETVCQEK